MHERLKKIRKTLDLTQQEFADRIGVKRNTVATYEMGRSNPSDSAVSLICREFNINESWLRDGIGEMFLTTDRRTEIERLTKQLMSEEEDSFKNRLISVLADLSVKEWEFLELRLKQLYEVGYNGDNITTNTSLTIEKEHEPTVEELEEEYKKSVLSSAPKKGFTVSNITEDIKSKDA